MVLSTLPSADLHHLCVGKRGRQVQWGLLEQWQLLWQVRFSTFFFQFLCLQVEAATMAGKVFQLFFPPISQPAIPIALQIIEFKILHGQHHSHRFEDTKIKNHLMKRSLIYQVINRSYHRRGYGWGSGGGGAGLDVVSIILLVVGCLALVLVCTCISAYVLN